ncbi:MAG: hypothetical protein R3244_03650 [Thermoanaerobaculia bacterium]|nr:hypothetical protein [Thermoanaerobaculia bacterium]
MIRFTQGEVTKTNLNATTNPTGADDVTQGYTVGSVWVNRSASPRRVFVMVDQAAGAAVWIQTTNTIDNTDSPGLYFLGSILDYSSAAGPPSGEVQYTRVFLLAGLTINAIEVFVDSGGSAGREIRLGIYDQATPDSPAGVPSTRVAQSASTPTGGADGTYLVLPMTTPYVVPVTGFYWLALVVNNSALKLVTTPAVYRENYPPVRRQTVAGTALPASASGLSNPQSAIAFVAATE